MPEQPELLQGEIVAFTDHTEVVYVEPPVEAQAYDEDAEIIVIVLDNGTRVFIG